MTRLLNARVCKNDVVNMKKSRYKNSWVHRYTTYLKCSRRMKARPLFVLEKNYFFMACNIHIHIYIIISFILECCRYRTNESERQTPRYHASIITEETTRNFFVCLGRIAVLENQYVFL